MEEMIQHEHKRRELTVESIRELYGGSHVANDVLLVDDFEGGMKVEAPADVQCLMFALCLEGECRYVVDAVEHVVRAGDIVVVGKGQTLSSISGGVPFKSIAMVMSYELFNESVKDVHDLSSLFLFTKNHPVYNLNPDEAAAIREYYSLIHRKVDDESHTYRRETVISLFRALLCDIANVMYRVQCDDYPVSRAEEIFMDFIALVELHHSHERRVGWYSQQLCLSPKYMSGAVKSVSRRTPNQWIDYYVMRDLRVELRNTSHSVKEIASKMNFSSQSLLGKYFKERAGMSPKEYRNS